MAMKGWLTLATLCIFTINMSQQHDREYYLNFHNNLRRLAKRGRIISQPTAVYMPRMKWSYRLEDYARYRAMQCQKPREEKFNTGEVFATFREGENPFARFVDDVFMMTFQPFTLALDRKYWNYYQMVWANSTYLGCAESKCRVEPVVVCQYWPPGLVFQETPYQPGMDVMKHLVQNHMFDITFSNRR